MEQAAIEIARIETFVLDAPIANPVRNSFRTLTSRSSLLLRITDRDGSLGWGEVWCNYPPGAAAHRAGLIEQVIAPMIVGRRFPGPEEAFAYLQSATRVPALQSGEPGPFSQAVAGIDIALWDLSARRKNLPIWRYLGGRRSVRVYASGLGPEEPERIAAQRLEEGFTAVKLKVGFDSDRDSRNLRALRSVVGPTGKLMVDANQRWDLQSATAAARMLDQFDLEWIEEPLAADEPIENWQSLARASKTGLAAGENLRGVESFSAAIKSGAFKVIQPDAAKWGGFTGCLQLARMASQSGIQFCPHWLGGGIGLAAALNLLASSGAKGWGEVDANPNDLRTLFLPDGFQVRDGTVTLSDKPGLGCAPEPGLINQFLVR